MTISPFRYPGKYSYRDYIITFENQAEVSHGGPDTGDLFVNGIHVDGYRFGGPLVFEGDNLFGPAYRKFAFHLAVLHLPSLKLRVFEAEPLVLIERVDNGLVKYSSDLDNLNVKVKQT